jgi:hypothetical protein
MSETIQRPENSVQPSTLHGTVRNGVVVPDEGITLPEGLRVEIVAPHVPPELQEEFAMWEAASDEDFAAFEEMLRDTDAGGKADHA